MSSSVSYGYSVRQEALRREHERRAAEDALLRAERRYEELRARAQIARSTWGESVDVPDVLARAGDASTEAMTARRAEIERRLKRAQASLDEQVVAARIELVRSSLAAIAGAPATPIRAEDVLKKAPKRTEAAKEPADATAKVQQLLTRVKAVDATASAAIRDAAAAALRAGSPSSREMAVDHLRLLIQRANDAARAAHEREEQLDRLEGRLDGCHGPAAGAARIELARVRTLGGELPRQLFKVVEDALEAEHRVQEVEFVRNRLRAVLEGLDYEVGPAFETQLAEHGYARALDPHRPGYGLQVRVGDDPAQVHLNLIKSSGDIHEDADVEREFCDGQDKVLAAMSAAGIGAQPVKVAERGAFELQVVKGLEMEVRGSRRRRAERERQA